MILDIQSLSAGYSARPVLRDFSLRVEGGQVAAVIGPNGSGKSTLLRCVSGLMRPISGRVLLDDADVFELPSRERAKRLALLPQSSASGLELSVLEMTLLGRTPHLPPYGTTGAHDEAIARRCLESVGAWQWRGRRLSELSGGERQRVLLARALCQESQVLLLDEPTSSLDIRFQHEILGLVKTLARRDGLAVLVVLHGINLAAQIADTLVLLDADGQTLSTGTPQEVMTQANLERVYGVPLRVMPHPLSGRPQAQSLWVWDDEAEAPHERVL